MQKIHKLGGYRNASRVLVDMEKEGLIQSFRQLQKVYYLAKKGRDWIGTEKEVTRNLQVEHHLMRGDMYLYLGCPKDFKPEFEYAFKGAIHQNGIIIKKDLFVRADGYFLRNGIPYFVEVDNTQSMKENRIKIKRYKALTEYLAKGNVVPCLIFYTTSDIRKQKLLTHSKELGIKCQVYTKKDIH